MAHGNQKGTLLTHEYGKSRVRVLKVLREGAVHTVKELTVSVRLSGDFDSAYTAGDNSMVVLTDTMKNTVNALAKDLLTAQTEPFAAALAQHFVAKYPQVKAARVETSERVWHRMTIGGPPHPHSFRGTDDARPTCRAVAQEGGATELESGITGLLILKSTASGFENYPKDEFTTLPETKDRILATSLDACWTWTAEPADYQAANAAIIDAMLAAFRAKPQPQRADDPVANGRGRARGMPGNRTHPSRDAEQTLHSHQPLALRPGEPPTRCSCPPMNRRADRGNDWPRMSPHDETLRELLAARDRGEHCALVTLVAVKGSTPRAPGAKMIVYADDAETSGTIGGEVRGAGDRRNARSARSAGSRAGAEDVRAARGRAGFFWRGLRWGMTVLIEPPARVESLYIVGGGHCSQALAHLAGSLGWRVTVIEDRPSCAPVFAPEWCWMRGRRRVIDGRHLARGRGAGAREPQRRY